MAMDRLPRVLILDTDQHTLITLQHVLEQADFDTMITRDEAEACQLLETSRFDLILIGNAPPELDAAAIVDDFSFRGTCPSVLILQAVVAERDVKYFRSLGAIGVVPKLDSLAVLDEVINALAPTQFKGKAATRFRSARAA
jgi:DNA-binding response OmpR family regulator